MSFELCIPRSEAPRGFSPSFSCVYIPYLRHLRETRVIQRKRCILLYLYRLYHYVARLYANHSVLVIHAPPAVHVPRLVMCIIIIRFLLFVDLADAQLSSGFFC